MGGRRAEGRVGVAGGRDFARGLVGVVGGAQGFTDGGILVVQIGQQLVLRLSGRTGGTIRLDSDTDSSTTILIIRLRNNDTVQTSRQRSEFGAQDEAEIEGDRVNQVLIRDGVRGDSQIEHEGRCRRVNELDGTGAISIASAAGGTRSSWAFARHTDFVVAFVTGIAVTVL